jgi:hypothetical protein
MMTQEKDVLGIGCIETILICEVCKEQIKIGEYTRADGKGEYIDYDNIKEQNEFIDIHDKCI